MNRLILLRHHLVSLACISLATATFVACGSGSTINPNDTEGAVSLIEAEFRFNSDFLEKDDKIAAQIEKCNTDPSACNVGDLPSTPTESSSSQATPSESSSSGAPIESSASVDPSSSSVVVKPSSSSQTTLPSSSSVAKPSSSSVASSSSTKSSSSVAPSSSSQTTPSSSSTAGGALTIAAANGTVSLPAGASTVTVGATNPAGCQIYFSGSGAISGTINGTAFSGSYHVAVENPPLSYCSGAQEVELDQAATMGANWW